MKTNIATRVKGRRMTVSLLATGHNVATAKRNMPMLPVRLLPTLRSKRILLFCISSHRSAMHHGTMDTRVVSRWMPVVHEKLLLYVFIGHVQWRGPRVDPR